MTAEQSRSSRPSSSSGGGRPERLMCSGAARSVPADIRVSSLQLCACGDPQGPEPEPKRIKQCEAPGVLVNSVAPFAACGQKT